MSRVPLNEVLVSTKWLAERLITPPKNLKVVDASWTKMKRDALQEYKDKHIPTAQFFDIDDCCDKSSKMPHMLPSAQQFSDYVGNMGIDNSTHVVLYDRSELPLFSSPRVWWTFKVFGHHSVSLLEGGLRQWIADGHQTTAEISKFKPAKFTASFNPDMVKSFEDVEKEIEEKTATIIDARGAPRFNGTAPDPLPKIRSGHMPGAVNIHYRLLMNQDMGKFKTPEELKKVFDNAGVDFSKPVTATCGSGVSACMLMLSAHLIGHEISVYDGSWVEWYQRAKNEHLESLPKDDNELSY